MIKKYFQKRMIVAFQDSENNIMTEIKCYSELKNLKILDVGCGNGKVTMRLLSDKKNYEIHGIDMLDIEKVDPLIKYKKTNLIDAFPFENDSFDIVVSNQVIEHILDKDNFLSECKRVLKTSGLFLCCTDNISAWDNIISLLFGQEPISQHTGSKYVTNSFFSPFFMKPIDNKTGNLYLHKNVSSYFGLQRLAQIAGFKNITVKSWGNICWFFEKIAPIYNRIILIKASK